MVQQILVRIKGGLGNQLFCYAAARSFSLRNKAELVIDNVSGFARDSQYKRKYALDSFSIPCRKAFFWERMEPFERYRRGLAKLIARQRPFHLRKYIEENKLEFDPRIIDCKPRSSVCLDGYWQSEKYFKDMEKIIRQDLRIQPPDDESNNTIVSLIMKCTAVSIHIRWFENPDTHNSNNNIGRDYYLRAIQYIRDKVADPHFFLFSDKPDAAKNMLKLPDDEVTCVDFNQGEDRAVFDMWLMSQCKHFIIANSTFSWWGAWLADSERKIIIAPDNIISGSSLVTAWGFDGLIPDNWVRL